MHLPPTHHLPREFVQRWEPVAMGNDGAVTRYIGSGGKPITFCVFGVVRAILLGEVGKAAPANVYVDFEPLHPKDIEALGDLRRQAGHNVIGMYYGQYQSRSIC